MPRRATTTSTKARDSASARKSQNDEIISEICINDSSVIESINIKRRGERERKNLRDLAHNQRRISRITRRLKRFEITNWISTSRALLETGCRSTANLNKSRQIWVTLFNDWTWSPAGVLTLLVGCSVSLHRNLQCRALASQGCQTKSCWILNDWQSNLIFLDLNRRVSAERQARP